jgi:signal transduction histidine kinase
MTEIEITDIPPLRPDEQSLLAMHSLLNVFNVLRGELVMIGLSLAGNDELLVRGLSLCDGWIASLRDPVASLEGARRVEEYAQTVFAEIDVAIAAHPEMRADAGVAESVANLHSAFDILRVRARELLARARHPDKWESFSITVLRQNIQDMFLTIEKHSRGRYRIIYNAALQTAGDYYVDFKLESMGGDSLFMPGVFQDVMRDLIANARKYTAPGDRITAALYEDAEALRFLVEDTGRGIPEGELEKVVHFGQRASNVGEVRTLGGGFGLTKAFLVTKQFGGRFKLASQLGVGTRVRIHIPRPGETPNECKQP